MRPHRAPAGQGEVEVLHRAQPAEVLGQARDVEDGGVGRPASAMSGPSLRRPDGRRAGLAAIRRMRSVLQESPLDACPSRPWGRSSMSRSRVIGYSTKRQVGASVPSWPSSTRRNPSRKKIHPKEAASVPVMLPRPPNTTMISGLKPFEEIEGARAQETRCSGRTRPPPMPAKRLPTTNASSLVPGHVDAHGLGGDLVLADRHHRAARAGADEVAHDDDDADEEHEGPHPRVGTASGCRSCPARPSSRGRAGWCPS